MLHSEEATYCQRRKGSQPFALHNSIGAFKATMQTLHENTQVFELKAWDPIATLINPTHGEVECDIILRVHGKISGQTAT